MTSPDTTNPDAALMAELDGLRKKIAALQAAHDAATGAERDTLAAQLRERAGMLAMAEELAGPGFGAELPQGDTMEAGPDKETLKPQSGQGGAIPGKHGAIVARIGRMFGA